MIRTCTALTLLLLAAPAFAQDAPPKSGRGLRLSSRDAARLAVRNDLAAAAARAARIAADARSREVGAAYDPLATMGLTTSAFRTESGSQLGGAPVLENTEQQITFGLSRTFLSGTNLRLEWVNRRTDSNSSFASFSPQYASTLRLTMTQPLLRDFGFDYHEGLLRSAKLQRGLAGLQLRQTLADIALAGEESYWNLVLTRANLTVARSARDLAADELRLVEQQRAAVRLAPVDVRQSRAGLAAADEQLIVAETAVASARDRLVKLVAPPARPDDWSAYDIEIVTTEGVAVEPQPVDPQAHVRRALAWRPAVRAARLASDDADLQRRLADRASLPRVDVVGSVSTDGLGRGAGEAGQDLGNGAFLGWSIGVQVEVPILNTLGSSRVSAAEATARERRYRLQDVETLIVLEIRNAVRLLDAAERRIAAAQAAREFSARKLTAEQDRLKQGLSTAFLVSRARADLTSARTREVRAQTDYRLAGARLRRADGSILDGILAPADRR